jgi:hypothetical protein
MNIETIVGFLWKLTEISQGKVMDDFACSQK